MKLNRATFNNSFRGRVTPGAEALCSSNPLRFIFPRRVAGGHLRQRRQLHFAGGHAFNCWRGCVSYPPHRGASELIPRQASEAARICRAAETAARSSPGALLGPMGKESRTYREKATTGLRQPLQKAHRAGARPETCLPGTVWPTGRETGRFHSRPLALCASARSGTRRQALFRRFPCTAPRSGRRAAAIRLSCGAAYLPRTERSERHQRHPFAKLTIKEYELWKMNA